jgi:glucosamine--fructose-6-phosphate aminotransferase (isomerizing)
MCGIVGYIGKQKASPILLAGLSKLEYRGYDSAGIATIEGNEIKVLKDKGRVENLYHLEKSEKLEGSIGIAHTRWATHGIPSKINSHPHLDNSNSFAVVHNGIIENYMELRKFLEDNGYHFVSDTDTEVIPNLIHYFYTNDSQNDDLKVLRALKNTCEKLIGSFSLEVLSKFMPDNCCKKR